MSTPTNIDDNVVAMFRLPLSVKQLSAICDLYGTAGKVIKQSGDWVMVITTTKEGA